MAKLKANENAPKIDEEKVEEIKKAFEDAKSKRKEANEAMREGKGVLTLEKPIESEGETITELPYDFTELTGMDYAEAMDSDGNALQIYRITYRQGLALFAKAVSKQVQLLDMRDIIDRLGITDSVSAVQLATLFFTASTRAGQMRISKKQ